MGAKKAGPVKAEARPEKPNYSEKVWFESQGRPVSFVTCLECGAAVMDDGSAPDATRLHVESHA